MHLPSFICRFRLFLSNVGMSSIMVVNVSGKHEAVIADCRNIIKLVGGVNGSVGARAWRRLLHALFTLQRFSEAEAAALEWISSSGLFECSISGGDSPCV